MAVHGRFALAQKRLVEETLQLAQPVDDDRLDEMVSFLKDGRVVMLGESTHGTAEYYKIRRLITQKLIAEHGFNFVAVEGDWPTGQAINRYAFNGEGGRAQQALRHLHRWPTWMWANSEVAVLAEWLRSHNANRADREKAGFFGLDVYSLFESLDAVVTASKDLDPAISESVARRYACFEPFERDEMAYAQSLFSDPEGCVEQALATLQQILDLRLEESGFSSLKALDLRQNARVVKNAETYYRAMMEGGVASWSVRDRHMLETLDQLLEAHGPKSKAIVWAHNTHIGDYRATNMALFGYVNIGGLAREKHGREQVKLLGFGSYKGEVIASHAWGGPAQILPLPAAREESLEYSLHLASIGMKRQSYALYFEPGFTGDAIAETHGHRAVGVVYDPYRERPSNYVPTILPQRYDAFVYLDETTALQPIAAPAAKHQLPETWPSGQ